VAAFDRAHANGCQSVLVTGEPGVGKSTLVRSLATELDGRDHLWLEFRCSELALASPLRPVITGLRDLLDIRDHDAPDQQLAKLSGGLDRQGAETAALLPYLADLLGIVAPGLGAMEGLSGELRRARTLDALVEWATAASSLAPLVIVTEDLQWADPTTRELLHRVRARAADRPVLCLCTSRVTQIDHSLFEDADHISLGRLSVAESRALASSLSATYAVPDHLLLELAERGDGIPLFIEELVRGAAESSAQPDGGAAGLPDTLQSLLAARLDRLGEARAIAQAASVIGRAFTVELLAVAAQTEENLLYSQLHQLVEAGIVTRQTSPSGESYTFRHALIQDAAYAGLLRRKRRELHGLIAAALPAIVPSAVTGAPELVAHHYEAAGAPLKAARWFADAGRRACERAALLEAITHYESGIALLRGTHLTEEAEELLLSLLILCANAHMGTSGPGGEITLPMWEDAIGLAEELGNLDELTSAMNGVATYRTDKGELDTTIEIATKILAISKDSGSRVAALRGHLSLAMAYFYRGEGVRALTHCDDGLALEREGDYFTVTYGVGHDQGTMGRSILAWSLWWSGRPDAALAVAVEAQARADRLPSSLSQAMALHMVGFIHHARGEAAEAMVAARSNIAATEEFNFPFWLGTSLLVLGSQRALLGDEGGLSDLDRAFTLLLAEGGRGGGSMGFALLAMGQQAVGLHDQAVATAELGLAISADQGQPFYDPELRRLAALSRYALDPDRLADTVDELTDSLSMARRMGAASFALRTATDLATLPGSDGARRTRAIGELEVALAQMGDGADTVAQTMARTRLAQLDPSHTMRSST
jgi:tetratricopeptide (TPR) repeat protein